MVFVIVPTSCQVDEAEFWDAVEGFDVDREEVVTDLGVPYRKLADVLRERELRVLDLLDVFRDAKTEGMHLYGSVDAHLSPAGHRVLARAVQQEFLRLLRNGDDSWQGTVDAP